MTVLGSGLNGNVRRISRTYDALDRLRKVTSVNNATVGSGTTQNELEYEYDRYDTVSKVWQEWTGAVTGSSPKVQFAYSFPTAGATGDSKDFRHLPRRDRHHRMNTPQVLTIP